MSFTYGVNKTSNVQYLAFSTYISPTCNGLVNYVSFSSFLDSLWPFITKPHAFHLQLSCTFFLHRTTTKSFISKPIVFWCTTFITLFIKTHAKGRRGKLLSMLLNFWLLSPYASAWLLKHCYTGHLFFFIFSCPLYIFYKYLKFKKTHGFLQAKDRKSVV